MNRRTAIALTIGLAFVAVVAGAAMVAASDDPASDAADTATETNDTTANMTQTEFTWGTITYENDSETGAVDVNVTVNAESDVSVSTMAAPNATDDYSDNATADEATADDAAVETFPWGVVIHETDADTGTTDVELLIDAADDVSVSVTSISEDGTRTSTSTISSTSTSESDGASVSQSTTTTSSSSSTSSSTVVTQSSSETDADSISIDVDTDDD